ncbi:MAG: FKBP-type peptidyl-prolyl cis-trans isomerase [Rubripirellula sp.]
MILPRFAGRNAVLVAVVCLLACGCGPKTGPGVIDADAAKEFTTTDSGLKYRILRKSKSTKPMPSDRVEVDYTGWLDDGTTFDSSYNGAKPAQFTLGQVVEGWNEGLLLIGEGGMIELEVPPELGYGEPGRMPKIPPNATLHFKIELLRIL